MKGLLKLGFYLLLIGAAIYGVSWGVYTVWMKLRVEYLVTDLWNESSIRADKSAQELKEIGARSVEPLIEALAEEQAKQSPREPRIDRMESLLEEITGKDLGDDPEKWRRWISSPEGQRFLSGQAP